MPSRIPPPGLLSALWTSAPFGAAVVGSDGSIAWSNPAFDRYFARGAGPRRAAPGEGQDDRWGTVVEAVRRSTRGGTPEVVRELLLGPPVLPTPLRVEAEVVPLPADTAAGRAAVFVRDVSSTSLERERARLFYTAFLTSTNAIEATDASGRLVDVNPAFEKIYGFRREEVIGQRPNVVRSSYTSPELYKELWKSITDPAKGSWSGELLNRDRQGREHPIFLTITAVRDPSGRVTNFLGVAVDLSERRAWEHQAAHADKLASLGQLAAGVAHEINTPLANVMLLAESMRRRTSDEWMRSRLTTVTQQVEVAARIVRGLLEFARRGVPEMKPVDLGAIAHAALEFVRGKEAQDVEFLTELPPEPVEVRGDRGQLVQVVTNLLMNAVDALEGRGTVRVAIRSEDRSAVLEIHDSGPGIPDRVMPHIFEPFFTTKGEGKGTGLGLAISHGIVSSHHGTISATNAPEGGAVFRITLPLLEGVPSVEE